MERMLKLVALFLIIPTVYTKTTLNDGEVAYTLRHSKTGLLQFKVTDGSFLLKATTYGHLSELVDCRLYTSKVKVGKLLAGKPKIENIGLEKIERMLMKCGSHETGRVDRATSIDDNDTFNHDLVQGKPFSGDFGTGSPEGNMAHMAIFPGTKWCGYENNALSMTDLGVYAKTDACCRTHDHCPYYIDRFESKYHYYNAFPWTISHCECDRHLFNCLKDVNTPTANTVGKLFFGLLNVKCFTFETGQYCNDESSILSKLWCGKKVTGQMAMMHKFPYVWGRDEQADKEIIG